MSNHDVMFKYCMAGIELDAINNFLVKYHEEFKADPRDEMRLLRTCIFIMDLFLKHGIIVIPDDKVKETSPRRKRIRSEVRINNKDQAVKMSAQFNKKNNIKVKEFSVNDKVTIKIPVEDRNKTDAKRLPCIITKVCGAKMKSYELQCEAGIIAQKYTANDLEPFSGILQHPLPDTLVTLRSAAISSRKYDGAIPMTCSCRTGCKATSKRCKCRVNNTLCTSRCHSGSPCLNVDHVATSSEESWYFPRHSRKL